MFVTGFQQQEPLLTPSFSEAVPPESLARLVVAVVESLDLKPIIRKYKHRGRHAYHPKMMLSLLFFAYSMKVYSSRQIADRVENDLRFMFITGRLRPDFRTISDFRKNNIDHLKPLFKQIVGICLQLGMATLQDIAIDGTKIKASASSDQTKRLDRLAKELHLDDATLDQWLAQAEQADAADASMDGNFPVLPVQDQDQLKALVQAARERYAKHLDDAKVNLTDPDCREMKHIGPAYNAQIAVDADHHLIVGEAVTTDANDRRMLLPMIEELEQTTESRGQPKTVAADSGYAASQAFVALDGMPHIDAYVPTQRQTTLTGKEPGPFDRENFTVDPATKQGRCPMNRPMRLIRQGINRHGQPRYHFIGTQCDTCPVHEECTTSKNRSIVILKDKPAITKMETKTGSAKGRRAGRMRRCTVEPVFGVLKEQMGFRRFHLRSLVKVSGEFSLLCIAYNLRKLFTLLGDRIGDVIGSFLSHILLFFVVRRTIYL